MKVTAPYSFVPLYKRVFFPENLGAPSQDEPLARALSGTIPFTLNCTTPILVAGAAGERGAAEKAFMTTPQGRPVIPGSSLRGMVRNVVEIAGFGQMKLVDDRRMAVRDLQASARMDYGSRISGFANGAFAPRSFAGYLQLVDGMPKLTPCEFGRIEHHEFEKLGIERNLPKDENGNRVAFHDVLAAISSSGSEDSEGNSKTETEGKFVEEKYVELGGALDQTLWVETKRGAHNHSGGKRLAYRRVTRDKQVQACDEIAGQLVFTGMPSRKKHMEFFFFDKHSDLETEIEPDIWTQFRQAHEAQEKKSLPGNGANEHCSVASLSLCSGSAGSLAVRSRSSGWGLP